MNNTRVNLAQVCDDLSDGLHKAPVFNPSGEYLFVNATNLENGYIVDKGEGKRADYSEYLKYAIELNENTILYSIDGTIGNIARYRGEKCILGKGACYLNVKNSVCADYIYYLLQSSYFTGYIASMSTGSTIHHISLETMRKFSFDLPPYETQKAIGGILATLDQKIHNNSLVCAELESMAKTLYDYWFVQFGFPDANGKPYRASGGELVWNEQLKREIPKEWSAKKLNQLADYGQAKAVSIDSDHYVGMDNMLPNMGGIVTSKYSPTGTGNVAFECGDILLGNIRPYFKKLWLSDFDGGCSPDVLAIHPKNKKISTFIYCTLGRDTFFDYDVKGCKGTKMPRGDKGHIMNYLFSFDESIALRFSQLADALFRKIQMTRRESIELAKLRDWLLPMLMNGQAMVAPAEAAPKLQILQPEKPVCDPRFDRWLQTQGVAARGTVDEQTLHDIFDAMDDDDKQ